jgi:hypothetical protein
MRRVDIRQVVRSRPNAEVRIARDQWHGGRTK